MEVMEMTWLQVRSQDFGGEGARIWVPAPKGSPEGVTHEKFFKNVHAIWCNILYLLHKIHSFSKLQSNVFPAFIR